MEIENEVFVGKKYEKFEKKVFSIPAFLFGGVYFAYRKMFLCAIIVSLLTTITDTLAYMYLNFGIGLIEILCIRTAIGLYFPLLYRKFYNSKVNKILLKNAKKSEQEQIDALHRKGRTSIGYIILFIIINTILMTVFNNLFNSGYKTNILEKYGETIIEKTNIVANKESDEKAIKNNDIFEDDDEEDYDETDELVTENNDNLEDDENTVVRISYYNEDLTRMGR
jgi:hypothetical protein